MAVACKDDIGTEFFSDVDKPNSPEKFTNVMVSFPWFALQVRARHEMPIVSHLCNLGYEWMLPLYKCRKRWSDRIKEVEAPLFPGYLFCRFDPQDRLPILKTPGVIQIVGQKRAPTPVNEAEIRGIQTLMASGLPNQPWPFLAVGDKVEIESGPLAGIEGILTSFKGSHRLVLSITLLQRSVAVEIDSAFVSSRSRSQPPRFDKNIFEGRTIQLVM